jgi:hypothetical protein
MAFLERPIIIIGAGRSGSSLLNEILGAHPEVHMLGEMEFTVPAMWKCFWQVSAAARERVRRVTNPELERREGRRVATIIREALDQFYGVSDHPEEYWGFKEIWMDSNGPQWAAYDAVFPKALYVHLVRHPLEYARSVADWNRNPFTKQALHDEVKAWMDYLETNRARVETGRYVLLTYEQLVADPRTALAPVLSHLKIGWDDACLGALERQHVPSMRRSAMPCRPRRLLSWFPRLAELMNEFGYQLEIPNGQASTARMTDFATPLPGGAWRLNPPFPSDGPSGWIALLHMATRLSPLAAEADDLQHLRRSRLRLFEDGQPLGPPHSLHAEIRKNGRGAYSHWSSPDHYLLFSTSDNSDPNRNGRAYTFRLDPEPARKSPRPPSKTLARQK